MSSVSQQLATFQLRKSSGTRSPVREWRRQSQDPHHRLIGYGPMSRRRKEYRGVHGQGNNRCNRSRIGLHRCCAVEHEHGSHSRSRTYHLALIHHQDTRLHRTVHKSSGRVSELEAALVHVRRKRCSHDSVHHRCEEGTLE